MSARVAEPAAPLSRDALAGVTLRTLSRGRWGNADVFLVETDDGPAIVKDFAPRRAVVRTLLGRWLIRREVRAYRALSDHPAVPRLLGSIDALAFALEYRPGTRLSRALAPSLGPGFVTELESAVRGLHARGVVHLDLRHRSNVLVARDGRPVLIDFASAVCFRPGGLGARLLLPWLARVDLRAYRKWEIRLRDQGTGADCPAAGPSKGPRGASRPTK